MNTHVDYIVVGGGISGCVLSYTLMKYGASVALFDLPQENKSSVVASGLWNPIVLKRMKKVWMADSFMEELETVYPDMEEWTETQFFDQKPIRRVFHNPGEENNWLGLTDHPGFASYLNDELAALPDHIKGAHASGMMKRTGRVRVREMIQAVHNSIKEDQLLFLEAFQWADVQRDEEGITYKNLRAHAIISCEGAQAALGKSELKQEGFAPVKGEVLGIQVDQDLGGECIHQGHFMLDDGNKKATVGATYAWDGFEEGPTPSKRQELEDHIQKVWNGAYEVVAHRSGVRPATKDRRPMVGPSNKAHTYVFNGMGSRAVLMAPFLAKVLTEHFMYGTPLLEEALPSRF